LTLINQALAKEGKMENKTGSLSIEDKNIFLILKKWLYTEQDIVFRELVSNASDAVEKRAALSSSAPEGEITLVVDAEAKLITISDNGIGMTADEVDRFINKIAFSGAADFINRRGDAETGSIIGHFGVGFYSAFMIAERVVIETKSNTEDEAAVRWECGADMVFSMTRGTRQNVGTDVILYTDEDSPYFKDPKTVFEILKKYFVFLKTPVFFNAPGNPDFNRIQINDTAPPWKQPDLRENEAALSVFYKEFFDDVLDPLFWVFFESLDIGIKGVVFFRNTKNGTEELNGSFKIYNRGVFVGENIPELIPKFVNLQSGIVECRDLPLSVSRSAVQDGEKNKGKEAVTGLIYETLVQEVTIAMNDHFTNKRKHYEALWPELNAFVKYSVLQDKTFASVMARKVIFQDLYGHYRTIAEYVDTLGAAAPVVIYYVTDPLEQAHYIEIFKRGGLNALLFDHVIDQPFLRKQELVHPNTRFVRIDSDIETVFRGKTGEEDAPGIETLEKKIKHALGERLDGMQIRITRLETEAISILIIHDEMSRRAVDMMEMYGMIKGDALRGISPKSTLLVNLQNRIIRRVIDMGEDLSTLILGQLFDLAMLSQGALNIDDIEAFIIRSERSLTLLIDGAGLT
jgi:molecular chaperone HtpG